jgi:hypothetical protein
VRLIVNGRPNRSRSHSQDREIKTVDADLVASAQRSPRTRNLNATADMVNKRDDA